VVVVATMLHSDTIMDFLNEFYAHPKLQVGTAPLSVVHVVVNPRKDVYKSLQLQDNRLLDGITTRS